MIKISAMYKDSGGTNPYHRCEECLAVTALGKLYRGVLNYK